MLLDHRRFIERVYQGIAVGLSLTAVGEPFIGMAK